MTPHDPPDLRRSRGSGGAPSAPPATPGEPARRPRWEYALARTGGRGRCGGPLDLLPEEARSPQREGTFALDRTHGLEAPCAQAPLSRQGPDRSTRERPRTGSLPSMVPIPSSPCGGARLSGDAHVVASRPDGPSRTGMPPGRPTPRPDSGGTARTAMRTGPHRSAHGPGPERLRNCAVLSRLRSPRTGNGPGPVPRRSRHGRASPLCHPYVLSGR